MLCKDMLHKRNFPEHKGGWQQMTKEAAIIAIDISAKLICTVLIVHLSG